MTNIIGEDEVEDNLIEVLDDEDNTLDGILRCVITNEEDFQRIKTGSRKRFLKDYKINYVKIAVDCYIYI